MCFRKRPIIMRLFILLVAPISIAAFPGLAFADCPAGSYVCSANSNVCSYTVDTGSTGKVGVGGGGHTQIEVYGYAPVTPRTSIS